MTESGHTVQPLTAKQRDVLRAIARYHEAVGEFPSVCYLARRLDLHHSTVQGHLAALHEKGWLLAPTPDGLRCGHVG